MDSTSADSADTNRTSAAATAKRAKPKYTRHTKHKRGGRGRTTRGGRGRAAGRGRSAERGGACGEAARHHLSCGGRPASCGPSRGRSRDPSRCTSHGSHGSHGSYGSHGTVAPSPEQREDEMRNALVALLCRNGGGQGPHAEWDAIDKMLERSAQRRTTPSVASAGADDLFVVLAHALHNDAGRAHHVFSKID